MPSLQRAAPKWPKEWMTIATRRLSRGCGNVSIHCYFLYHLLTSTPLISYTHLSITRAEPINIFFFFFALDISQSSGLPWNAYIGCTSSGLPEGTTRCQMTDQSQYPGDCVTIAYFDPGYISVNENGYCSFGYNGKGPVFFEETTPDCAYADFIKNGNYMAKGQVTPHGILELLWSDDGGSTFYNEGTSRLALNAAAH